MLNNIHGQRLENTETGSESKGQYFKVELTCKSDVIDDKVTEHEMTKDYGIMNTLMIES